MGKLSGLYFARDEVGDLARTFALMQQQLRRQEEARRAFVATASHELRTPVASLDGLLELLDEDLQSGQPDLNDARTLLDRARGQSRRLGRLAADLLDLSRIDAQTDLRSEPVELGELMDHTFSLRFRVDGDVLTVKDIKFGLDKGEDLAEEISLLVGRYTKKKFGDEGAAIRDRC